MSQDWVIKSRAHACAVSGEPFADGANIYSVLSRGEEGYVRADISEAHWQDAPRENVVSFWRTVYQAPPPPAVFRKARPAREQAVPTERSKSIRAPARCASGRGFAFAEEFGFLHPARG